MSSATQQNKNKSMMLIRASYKGDLKMVEELIKQRVDVNSQELGQNALLLATCFGHIKIVEKLIEAGGNINLQNTFGSSILNIASNKGYLKIVKKLIEVNAIIDDEFIKEINKYDIDILKLLVTKNFNIGLKYATKFGKQEDIKYHMKTLIAIDLNKDLQYEQGLIGLISNYCA
jgi:ankyrin repeat protein